MANLQLLPIDITTVLEANTVGKRNKSVKVFLSAAGPNPDLAVQKICTAMHKRSGSSVTGPQQGEKI